MAVRRESVQISVDSNMTAVMARDAAAIALVRRELDQLNGHPFFQANSSGNIVNINRNAQQATQSLGGMQSQSTRTSASLNQTGQSINQLTGRLGLFADAALILGPGLIPIAAVGVQALGGLTAAATAAAVAGGSAIVAFQGVGDAMKALDAYRDDSSIENLAKAKEALYGLAPAAKQFIFEFQKFRPVLAEIRDSAAAGWFPGLTASLDDFEQLAPRIESIFGAAGRTGGFLVEEIAQSLTSDRWSPFLDFLEAEVPGAMASLTRTMGDLAHGAAEMFMSFDPGNDAFLGWLEDVASGFDSWASSAESQQGIENLLAYARENGPAVRDLFTSLVGALTAIVQAAAPLGGPVLQGLTAVSETVRLIAESDMATPLLAAVAALRLMQRVQGLVAVGQNRMTTAVTRGSAAQAMAAQRAANSVAAWNPGYSGVRGQGNYAANLAAALVAPRASDVRAQQRAQRMQYARGGAMAAGVGLLASGAASDIGLTNTAMLALAGTMAGPWGAAAGAAAGLALDAAKANNDLTASIDAASSAIASGDFVSGIEALAQAREQQAAFTKDMDPDDWSNGLDPGFYKNTIEGWFGSSDVEEGAQALKDLERQMFYSQRAAVGLADAMGLSVGPADGSARSIKELQTVLEQAAPAMDALGLSQQDLFDAKANQASGRFFSRRLDEVSGTQSYDEMAEAIAAKARYMDTAAAKADNYKVALEGVAEAAGSAADRADAFREAMSALVDPANDAEAALDAQKEALQAIRQLETGGGFSENSDTGREARNATREYTDAVQERIATMIEAKRSEDDIAGALAQSREQFIESGVAAGFSAKQMEKRADAIGLTPQLVETTFTALGITATDRAVRSLRARYAALPKNVQSYILLNGVPKSVADAKRVASELNLTAKERRALLRLVTEGMANAQAARALMASLRDKTVTLRVNEIRTLSQRTLGRAGGRADGGSIPKDNGTYEDKYLYMLAPGEEVISNRYGQADRFRADRAAGRIPGYADGGTVGLVPGLADGGTAGGRSSRNAARALKDFEQALKASTSALERERQKRDNFLAYKSEVAGSLAGELTGNGLAGFDAGVAANKGDARKALYYLKKAKSKGLDGPLFDLVAGSGDLNLIQQMADLSRKEIASREFRYGASRSAQNALGNFAAENKYDTTLNGLGKSIKTLNAETKRLGKRVQAGAREGTRQGMSARSRRASTGTRAGR